MIWCLTLGVAFGEELRAVDAVAERMERSVVTLHVVDPRGRMVGSGTGFVVRADGLIATNQHVADAHPRRAVFADGRELTVLGLVVSDELHDLAILKVAESLDAPLPVATTSPAVGDEVVVLGSPHALANTRTTGAVTAVRPEGMPDDLTARGAVRKDAIQLTSQFSPGSSGSPIVRASDGLVVAVAQAAIPEEALFIGVDGAALSTLLTSVGEAPTYAGFPSVYRDVAIAGGLAAVLFGIAAGPSVAQRWRKRREKRRPR